jgi:hypothetical protein
MNKRRRPLRFENFLDENEQGGAHAFWSKDVWLTDIWSTE